MINELATNLPPVKADPGMMEQILMNLAVNARDAMPSGGQVIIGTEVQVIDAASAELDPKTRQGRFACLTVRDTGTGIAPENMSRIFEPFFTTKGVGKGTGLGLATVFGIAEQHQGWVDVSSKVGVGTTFRVFLPITQDQVTVRSASTRSEVRGGGERILVVEDDMSLRTVISAILQRHGYAVVEAESGVAARELWRQQAPNIDLLVTDMVMPGGMTGLELVDQLRALKPGLKAVLTSGYSSELLSIDVAASRSVSFLKKPFSAQTLATTVRQCLDATAQTPLFCLHEDSHS